VASDVMIHVADELRATEGAWATFPTRIAALRWLRVRDVTDATCVRIALDLGRARGARRRFSHGHVKALKQAGTGTLSRYTHRHQCVGPAVAVRLGCEPVAMRGSVDARRSWRSGSAAMRSPVPLSCCPAKKSPACRRASPDRKGAIPHRIRRRVEPTQGSRGRAAMKSSAGLAGVIPTLALVLAMTADAARSAGIAPWR